MFEPCAFAVLHMNSDKYVLLHFSLVFIPIFDLFADDIYLFYRIQLPAAGLAVLVFAYWIDSLPALTH